MAEVEVLTMEELAQWLDCTTQAIRQAMREDGLPGRKIGSRWCFSKTAIDQWLAGGTWASEKARRKNGKTVAEK